ncbi:WXG100 family type VII secretion target [Streptomyces daliensis]|uniref:WXG100 family type VII secretion target n=1 Tax=Streptomyces daliensis TaxID=299421 RepID=A0A8T4IS00_9ACTN|nr:WXG100 family type VII secretion target [Streptomyces daliensis]
MGGSNGGDDGFFSALNPARMIQDLFVETDFESKGHPDMEKMIESADPEKAERLGAKLVKAAKTIEEIGDDLKRSKDKVDWDSEGGDSFRTWVIQMSSATLSLADLSKNSGENLRNAAQTLREVKRDMPKYSASSKAVLDEYLKHNPAGLLSLASRQPDPPGSNSVLTGPSQSSAYDAQSKLNDDHGEAVRQMRKLAQSYSMSSMVMNASEPPTFPPIPKGMMPPKPDGLHDSPVSSNNADSSTNSAARVPGGQSGSSSAIPSSHVKTPDHQVGTNIDGGVTAPHPPTTSPVTPTPNGPSNPPSPVSPMPIPGVPTPSPRSPFAKPVTGTGRSATTPGQSRPSRPGVRMPGDGNGIYGGRPGTPNNGQPPRGLPRGTVVGGEAGQQGRGAMGGRPGAPGMGGPGGNKPGVVGGRPLATRPGGTFGGSQPRPGAAVGRPFTPGGTGLTRGPGGPRKPGERREENGERPDYLVEDEETWQQPRSQRAAPPVVD